MKICIIGWYGTETIGDRAIFSGILSFLSQCIKGKEIEINLGALYPFYTERMVNEDFAFWKKITNKDIKIKIFNSKLKNELKKNIENSEVVLVGGGPLMHIEPLYMINYAFQYAKKLNKKAIIFGCGIGPLFYKEYKKITLEIIKNADLVILRDEKSKKILKEISKENEEKLDWNKVYISYDPAVQCLLEFKNKILVENIEKQEKLIVINLRSFPKDYSQNIDYFQKINNCLKDFIKKVSEDFSDFKIVLVPMHYFSIGDDDRKFLNEIIFENNFSSIINVQNEILTLEETMEIFSKAQMCIGMRFHSIVFQTILNRNNYILDYTDKKLGKIIGFLEKIDKELKFYNNRYFNLQNNIENIDLSLIKVEEKFEYDEKVLIQELKVYTEKVKEILNEDSSYN